MTCILYVTIILCGYGSCAVKIINCCILGRYDCTVAKSAIPVYTVIYTTEICVYISQKYIIHKYKMKAFYNRTYSSNKCLHGL
jgi:competence CoiA-like predicted nuclease